ncbi:SixA phosphatase family protein [Persicirhabdus sediminis]|uniref:Histidine phosphatase family protein n=1 Tax=Persicirhabdus sediminis TaxID=454144 RepID=A0A8J7ME33_9BACT|nr:phosphoglycerate mutase family protein [Persicirhabdus sediminis]MBK1791307.1 histidine phosphatase family protein [Persicirhabdus sediminis]
MDLIIIRHAKAEDNQGADGERALTDKGISQGEAVGDLLIQLDLEPDVVLASPLVRARQTAEAICSRWEAATPIIEPWLSCGMPPSEAKVELQAYSAFQTVAIVGHEPDLSCLVEHILGMQIGCCEMKKASVCYIKDVKLNGGGGVLGFLVPVAAMAKKASE